MSYALANYPPTAGRHIRSHENSSIANPASNPLSDLQQREFPHLTVDSLSTSNKPILRPPPDYSIVPSTIKVESAWIESHLDTFPRFKELPAELRIMIYRFACLEPRVVPIWPVIVNRAPPVTIFRFESETPAIMQVCREARQEAQKLNIYQPTTNTQTPYPRIWIKPRLDIICPVRNSGALWTDFQFSRFADVVISSRVKRLALDCFSSSGYQHASHHDRWDDMANFPRWMNQHVCEIFLYTSMGKNNIRRQPLELVETIDFQHGPDRWTQERLITMWRADMKFARLSQMVADLDFYRAVQNNVDGIQEKGGQVSIQLPFVPNWLYENRKIWSRPALTRLFDVGT
ncbi:hypothetical protein DSL72_002960 [Monilinia vaccinii-corymbosi]|uniref:2EXR domain-containing protein n=1 Tax=Monilinia vaccinii-corymbosi TaxID=61207 RepID=A0A8A3PDV1_9HELO|nr:hypothetical protein DSL72_002960 [Monilinia vaccinii-corymbosi]